MIKAKQIPFQKLTLDKAENMILSKNIIYFTQYHDNTNPLSSWMNNLVLEGNSLHYNLKTFFLHLFTKRENLCYHCSSLLHKCGRDVEDIQKCFDKTLLGNFCPWLIPERKKINLVPSLLGLLLFVYSLTYSKRPSFILLMKFTE